MLSVCGIVCNECEFFKSKCQGCYAVSGKPFWVKGTEKKICDIYNCCVKKRGLDNCGQCSEVPCQIIKDLRPEDVSEDEHLSNLENQVKRFSEDVCVCSSTYCSIRGNCRKCYESHHDINSLPVCLR